MIQPPSSSLRLPAQSTAIPEAGKGTVVWFTGLSGAGKSTLARAVAKRFVQLGISAEVIDGDDLRRHLSAGLGFSRRDREENVRRAACLARILLHRTKFVLVALIAPYRAARAEVFDLRVFESGEPFCLAFQGRPSNPTASGTLDGVLRQMLSPWPRNFNPPLTIIHLGRVLDDRDGTADLLKQRAEQLWDLGAPPPDSRQLRWLAWSARRTAVAVECCASEAAQDTPLLNFLAAEALDRCIVAYCQAQNLWAAPFPEFLSLGGEAKYSEIVAAAKSFFHADSAAARQAVLFQVVELMRAAIARHLPAGV